MLLVTNVNNVNSDVVDNVNITDDTTTNNTTRSRCDCPRNRPSGDVSIDNLNTYSTSVTKIVNNVVVTNVNDTYTN